MITYIKEKIKVYYYKFKLIESKILLNEIKKSSKYMGRINKYLEELNK